MNPYADRSWHLVVILGILHVIVSSAYSRGEPIPITPDVAVQAKIRDLAKTIDGSNREGGDERFCSAVVALDRATRKDRTELVRQLIWFRADAMGDAEALALHLGLHVVNVSKGDMARAVIPLFGAITDSKWASAINDVANVVEDGSAPDRPPDFSYYVGSVGAILENKLEAPGLPSHMFDRSPGGALQAFAFAAYRDERAKPFLWARHVVDESLWKRQFGFVSRKDPDAAVTGELGKMAAREEWWARLYAAEIIRQHPEFGTAELIERLRSDSHPLVKETATAIP